MSHYVSVKNRNGKYIRHKVPEDVYIYIRQLETYIQHPQFSKLKELYKTRFGHEAEVDMAKLS